MKCTGQMKNLSLDYITRKPEVTLAVDAHIEDVERLSGMKLSVELKQYKAKRSLEANAYYWVLCTQIAKVIGQSNAWVHNHMLRRYGQIELVDGQAIYLVFPDTEAAEKQTNESETYHVKPTSQVQEGKKGLMYRTYMLLRGSHDYDTAEMATLIDGVISEAKELGIETITDKQLQEMMIAYYDKHN